MSGTISFALLVSVSCLCFAGEANAIDASSIGEPARALVELDLLLADLSEPLRFAVTESVPRHIRSVGTTRFSTTASSSHGTTVYPARTAATVRY